MRPPYWPEGGQPHRANPFDWIVKGKLAASWWPDESVFRIYRNEGIKVVINCSEFDNSRDMPEEFEYYHINIPDYGKPTQDQIDRFLKITDTHQKRRSPIVVHCVAGCGRTGQMIVAWAAHNGYLSESEDPVKWVRAIRPCCLETKDQVSYARKIAKEYYKT